MERHTDTIETARVYARIALLRRRVLAEQALRRALAGSVAAGLALVALGFATAALYLWLAAELGALGATLILACGYLFCALLFGLYAARRPHSPELDALAQMEAEARDKTALALGRVSAIAARAEAMSGTFVLGFGAIKALMTLFGRRRRK